MRQYKRCGAGLLLVIGLVALGPAAAVLPQGAVVLLYLPTAEWQNALDAREDVAYDVAVDAQGEAVVVGTSEVVKYAPSGAVLWRRALDAPARAVAVDALLGNPVVAGDGGLAKYTAEGRLLWRLDEGEAFWDVAAFDDGTVLALTAQGAIRLFGADGRPLKTLAPEAWREEDQIPQALAVGPLGLRSVAVVGQGFVALLDVEDGQIVWQLPYEGEARDAAFTSGGLLVVVGTQGVEAYSASEGERLWRTALPDGVELWAVTTLPPSDDEALRLQTTDDVVLVTGAIRLGDDWDFFTAKYTATGELFWSLPHDGGYGDDVAFGIAAHPTPQGHARVYVTGFTSKPIGGSSGRPDSAALIDRDYLTVVYLEKPLQISRTMAPGVNCPGWRPIADFEIVPTTPVVGEFVQFQNLSTDPDGWVVSSAWDFGDGTTSQAYSPTHVYTQPGTYTITLTVVDNSGCVAQVQRTITIGVGRGLDWRAEPIASELLADFTWTVERETRPNGYPLGYAPPPEPTATDLDTVHFEDLSTSRVSRVKVWFDASGLDPNGTAVLWEWDFGDGTTATYATAQNPEHEYDVPGSYTVRITITDAGGLTRVIEETLTFSADPLPITRWEWDLDGDAALDAFAPTPSFDYPDNAAYDVTLTVEDALGTTATVTKTLNVVNVPPQPDFLEMFLGIPKPKDKIGNLEFVWQLECWTRQRRFEGRTPFVVDVPPNAGALQLQDISLDSEPWGSVTSVQWAFSSNATVWYLVGSASDPNPIVLLLNSLGLLYWGPVDVTLTATDDDGDSWSLTRTLFVDNIPPCAGFLWGDLSREATASIDCEACVKLYGRGDEYKETKAEALYAFRSISRPKGSESCPKYGALCSLAEAVTYGFEVTLYIEGAELIDVREVVPPGWTIDCSTANLPSGLICTPTEISGTLKGRGKIVYTMRASPGIAGGVHTIEGTFGYAKAIATLNSDVVVCDLARLEKLAFSVDALGETEWQFPPGGDWNGDALVSFDWLFSDSLGNVWTATGEQPTGGFCSGGTCVLTNVSLTCDATGRWRYDVDVELTVTDAGGASNTYSQTITLTGPCR